VDRAALKRPAEAEDIVGGALMLASPLSAYMTGQTLVIDGGRQFI
jgi:NAD(P)-dependent dehydrogenase (short-subunit alcohol dehydrogenase family)